ncbi:MAG: RNA-guided endonuclease TnpB family protein [Thaumarchaeota archaeon]|nr:RNA-guided endonuclease TnpB family protein [Nitrososphaerota archaeon]
MKSVKAVRFGYKPTQETRELLSTFRMMVNHAINIALEEKIKGRLRLRDRIYKEFNERYSAVTCYPYSVAEVAWSIVKKHRRWHRKPVAEGLMLKMDSASYSLNYGILSLPNRKGQRLLIPLKYGDWQRSFLMDASLKRGSVTMTEFTIVIAFSREAKEIEPVRKIGYDLNHKSVVGSDGTRIVLSKVARLHTEYGVRRSEFYERHSNDRRLKQKFSGSRRERERIKQTLNVISKQVVEKALRNREAIVLERLKGIRKAHMKGNGMGRGSRRRANLWPFRLLQQQISNKAAWAGVQVEFVDPRNTSKECSRCHYINKKLKVTERSWLCPECGCQLDRDLNAAVNIERRGKIPCLPMVQAGARGMDEAVKGNEAMTAPILLAEAPKLGNSGRSR